MRLPLLLLCSVLLTAGETVTVCSDSFPPFNGTPGAEKPGSLVEVSQKIFAAAGYTLDYKIMPWNRTLEEVKAGRLDGAIGAATGMPDVDKLVFPPEAQGYWKPVFITPAGSTWTYTGPDSLKGLTIGTIPDYDYDKDLQGHSFMEWFAANPQKVQSIRGDKPAELAAGMLAKKRLDLFIEDWSVVQANATSAKVDLAQLRNAGQAGAGYPLTIAFSPGERGRKLAKILSDGTVTLRASGELAKILASYGQSDWEK